MQNTEKEKEQICQKRKGLLLLAMEDQCIDTCSLSWSMGLQKCVEISMLLKHRNSMILRIVVTLINSAMTDVLRG